MGTLRTSRFEVGENRWIDLDPLARNLKERAGKQVIENVIAAVRHRAVDGLECSLSCWALEGRRGNEYRADLYPISPRP